MKSEAAANPITPESLPPLGRGVVLGWLGCFFVYMLLLAGSEYRLIRDGRFGDVPWKSLVSVKAITHPKATFEPVLTSPALNSDDARLVKLLFLALYVSAACLVLPMPTHWVISLLSVQAFAPFEGFWATTLVVGAIAAFASMVASVNDYLIFYWLFRRKAAKWFRATRLYDFSLRHYSRQPFLLLGFLSTVPIATWAVRMLAVGQRYPLPKYAAANFLGRFVLYCFIAGATFALGAQGWIAAIGLLVLACVLALFKLAAKLVRSNKA